MKVLVLGGTRSFGIHLIQALLDAGHQVTVAPRGLLSDYFGEQVRRVQVERTSMDSLRKRLGHETFDVVCDNLALCSEDVRTVFTALKAARYVTVSSASVYLPREEAPPGGLVEGAFDPYHTPLAWSRRNAVPYEEGKRRMECALFQTGPVPCTAVRFPPIIGEDDHSKRLFFYVEHIYKRLPMHIANPELSLSFISSRDAGAFLAWLAGQDWAGPVNACNAGSVTIREILSYIESKCRRRAVLSPEGDPDPYGSGAGFALDASLASAWGYEFPPLESLLANLLNGYLKEVREAVRLQRF